MRPRCYSVVETPGRAYHRYCAVAQAVHLIETARLVPARHQKNVRAGLNAVRETVVEADFEPHAVAVVSLQVAKHLLEITLAAAEHRKVDIVAGHHLPGNVTEDVESFLDGKT